MQSQTDIQTELQHRSQNGSHINHLVYLLQQEQGRHDCRKQLGGATDAETTINARAMINPVQLNHINQWIRNIEAIKGKPYAKVGLVPDGGITATLHTARATAEELALWYDIISKTTYANGTRYQPLPSHDEAWQAFHRARTELAGKRNAAERWIYTFKKTIPMSIDQLIDAARNGLWEELPIESRRQLYKALPRKQKERITAARYGAIQAEQETRKHYDKLYMP